MQKNKKDSFKILTLISILILIPLSGCTKEENNDTDNNTTINFECIASKSTLFISEGCVACAKQKDILGEDYNNFTVINCKEQKDECLENEIFVVPTWIINNENYEGVHQIEELKILTNC